MATEQIINGLMRVEDLELNIHCNGFGQWIVTFCSSVPNQNGGWKYEHLYTFTSSEFADAVNTASLVMDAVKEHFTVELEETGDVIATSKRR